MAAQGQKSIHLYPIEKNNRFGYINERGKVVIKPQFRNAGDFNNNLAPARAEGYWGYINKKGVFVIQPEYDFALPFEDGLAVVVKDSLVFQIDTKGMIPKDLALSTLNSPGINLDGVYFLTLLAQYQSSKNGNDIICQNNAFSDLLVMERYDSDKGEFQYGVKDAKGNLIVPFGKYAMIHPFKNGVAKVEIKNQPKTYENRIGFINTKGDLRFEYLPSEKHGPLESEFVDSIAIVKLYKYWRKEPYFDRSPSYSYPGYIHLNGKIILNDTTIESVTAFSEGRAFVEHKPNREIYLIDSSMNIVNPAPFGKILLNGKFKNGLAFASRNGRTFGLINKSGNFVVEEKYEDIDYIGIIDDYFFFKARVDLKDYTTIERYGVSDTRGKILVQPCFDYFDLRGFVNGILRVNINGKMAYINRNGQIIWRYTPSDIVRKLNIDYALPYGCYTSKKKISDQPTTSEMAFLNALGCAADTFSIRVDCSKYDTIEGKWLGYRFYVVNRSNKKVQFDTFGMGMEMGLEALDVHGVWRTTFIETFGDCMNDTFCIFLEPNHCWTYTVPVFEGLYKTKYRVFATYRNHKGSDATNDTYLKLVSNEFEGGFNPAQFWRSAPSPFEMGFMGN